MLCTPYSTLALRAWVDWNLYGLTRVALIVSPMALMRFR
jgi:hypothetical protein